MTDATNTAEGFARIGIFDRLEALERKYDASDRGVKARMLKRDLIASAFGAKESAAAVDFYESIEAEWAAAGNRPPPFPDLHRTF